MNITIRGGARDIIYKVFIRCLAEFQAGSILTGLKDVYQRTADFTGVSVSTVHRVAKLGSKNGGKFSTPAKHRKGRPTKELDDFHVCAIRQKVQLFYTVKKVLPTVGKLLAQLREDIAYNGSREHLRRLLKKIGFSFKKCKTNRLALIEKPNIAHKRECYLREIIKNRSLPEELQKDIIYLDESYIHQSYKIKKCWQALDTDGLMTDISKGKRWIIVHAGNEKGLVPDALLVFSGNNKQEDYHSEMNQHNFTKWVKEKLIPNIIDPSIIVMDNAPYHSVVKNKSPTFASKVADIKQWLTENNVYYDPNLRKPSLMELVKKNKPEPVYEIDEIFGEFGHTVVRLPPYHCDLNPIELIWGIAKQKIATHNVGSRDVKELTIEAFNSITVQDWNNCVERVKKIEKDYYERGSTLYDDIDELVIQIGADSSSSSEDEYENINDEPMFDDTNVGAGTSTSDFVQIAEERLDFDLLD